MLNPDTEVEEEMSFRCFLKIAKRDYYLRHVYPSFRLGQLSSHWTDIYETRYSRIFKKSVQKLQVALRSEKNNRYFT